MTFDMRLFKKNRKNRKKVVARTSHIQTGLTNRYGKKVSAIIQSFPPKKFDERYRSDLADEDTILFEDGNGNLISRRKWAKLVKKKRKRG